MSLVTATGVLLLLLRYMPLVDSGSTPEGHYPHVPSHERRVPPILHQMHKSRDDLTDHQRTLVEG